jgi:hypothetical protein
VDFWIVEQSDELGLRRTAGAGRHKFSMPPH